MPELPDVTLYVESLAARLLGEPLVAYAIKSPFVLRTVDPPLDAAVGLPVTSVERLGKRIVLGFGGEIFLVVHLMIAGRFRWLKAGNRKRIPPRLALAELEFAPGTLVLTEAGTTRRASLHLVRGRDALAPFDRGGLEPLEATLPQFAERLARENHTLKRSLTDPRLFSGIGNAYSDELLHRARLSPLKLTSKLTTEEVERLFTATRETLREWTARLRAELVDGFPEKVTAFHDAMAVHGRYKLPCPVCGTPVQRIRYRDNETNYCPRCQTEGRLLADRALSRLLKSDWPKTIDELEG
ncbi:MAG: formamidopyrimidine-DNA glycosylase [Gemmatimonadaceae bacterium]|nr:formamidopyrimidine-DNA glycosylase [Gemmatimonadaceae bacterium]NUO95405.1 formamidopyrimidine-DNA glycosylase [Gemmatimonadaceae bacterium]NUP57748.1 formamidopyrimidine-DNA glycosylase [Gemmatimonadaceae bacterium]NUS34479.1 formamidopyrimidine-DNA glycosylase [Gemmatimonadaceae bacterium]NUS49383.1 formamidopyrimidine-DNA glycosylase [Gemmatimonadaceae bacterium]